MPLLPRAALIFTTAWRVLGEALLGSPPPTNRVILIIIALRLQKFSLYLSSLQLNNLVNSIVIRRCVIVVALRRTLRRSSGGRAVRGARGSSRYRHESSGHLLV